MIMIYKRCYLWLLFAVLCVILCGCSHFSKEITSGQDKTLNKAITTRNLEAIHEAALNGENLDTFKVGRKTTNPILYSLEYERSCIDDVVKTLLQEGADPNWRDADGNSLLMFALGANGYCYGNSAALLELLVQYGGDLSADCDGTDILTYGISRQGISLHGVNYLIEQGVAVSKEAITLQLQTCETVLPLSESDYRILKILLDNAAPEIVQIIAAETPQMQIMYNATLAWTDEELLSIYQNHPEILSFAVGSDSWSQLQSFVCAQAGNLSFDDQYALLLLAIQLGNVDAVSCFDSLFSLTSEDRTALLMRAITADQYAVVAYFLANHTELVPVNHDAASEWEIFDNCLAAAAKNGNLEMMELLRENGFPFSNSKAIANAALAAAAAGQIEAIETLYPDGKFPDGTEDCDWLIEACANTQTEVVSFLLAHGYLSYSNEQALCNAVQNHAIDIIQQLLTIGVNATGIVTYADGSGMSALTLAVQNGDLAILQLLIQQGADVNATDASGRTALFYAAQRPSVHIVQELLASGALPNHADLEGDTALDVAKRSATSTQAVVDALQTVVDTGKN